MTSSISNACQCDFSADKVLAGMLNCTQPLSSTRVLYRSELRGFGIDDCGDLERFLGEAVQSNPSVSVLGNDLDVLTDCDIGVSSVNSEVRCSPSVTPEIRDIGTLVGAVVAGVVVLLLLIGVLVVSVLLLVAMWWRKKKREL